MGQRGESRGERVLVVSGGYGFSLNDHDSRTPLESVIEPLESIRQLPDAKGHLVGEIGDLSRLQSRGS